MPRARKICSHAGNGRTCSQLAEERSNRCAEHKRPHGWSNAKTNSPYDNPEWRRLQPKILQRDEHRCRLRFSDICEGKATQVDHLGGVAAGGSFLDPSNLVACCGPCHRRKTAMIDAPEGKRRAAQAVPKPPSPHTRGSRSRATHDQPQTPRSIVASYSEPSSNPTGEQQPQTEPQRYEPGFDPRADWY